MNKLNHQFGHRNSDKYFIGENDITVCTLTQIAPNRKEELFIEYVQIGCMYTFIFLDCTLKKIN